MKKIVLKMIAFLCLALALCGCVQYIDDKEPFEPPHYEQPEPPKPKPPSNLCVVYSMKKADISCDIVNNADDKVDGYRVYRSPSEGGKYDEVDDQRIYPEKPPNIYYGVYVPFIYQNNITYSIQNHPPKTTYYYKMSVYRNTYTWDDNNENSTLVIIESELSAPVEVTIHDLRYPPDEVSATLETHNSVRVEWNAAHDIEGGVAYDDVEYNVYRNSTLVGTTPYLFYEDIDLSFGTVYEYTIATVADAADAGLEPLLHKSPPSNRVLTRPGKPVINAEALYSTSTDRVDSRISWNPLTGADSYNVYWCSTADGSYTPLKEGLKAIQYTDTSFVLNTYYYYKVSAVNTAGEGERSEYAVMIMWTAPSGVKAEFKLRGTLLDINVDSIKIDWDEYPGFPEFRLYRIGINTTLVATTSNNTYIDETVDGGINYYYRVVAVIDGYESAPMIASALTRPSAPTGVKISYTRETSYSKTAPVISWNSQSATGYRVYRNDSFLVSTTSNSYTDWVVSRTGSCTYYVTAYNASGESSSSGIVVYE